MPFKADPHQNAKLWDYILGDYYKGMSIAVDRWYYLQSLNYDHEIKVAFKDPNTGAWTKWEPFPGTQGYLWEIHYNKGKKSGGGLAAAIDVHRSVLPYEIIIESDYPTYNENYDAAKIIGAILEKKGFIPHYYYSGNKSVHIHVFIDWNVFKGLDILYHDRFRDSFGDNEKLFRTEFIKWIRAKMISCWDTEARIFDSDLIRASHLIRCELSKNTLGFKTFLGYTYKDMSFIPYICNENNRIYPKLGKIKLSRPLDPRGLLEEFLDSMKLKDEKRRIERKNRSLNRWAGQGTEIIRKCVKTILSKEFKDAGDGFKRGMFILVNELTRILGETQAKTVIADWNQRMQFPIHEKDITSRINRNNYTLTCDYIHSFLKDLGIDISGKCKGKVYKE